MSSTIQTATLGELREMEYLDFLKALDKHEVHALCAARLGDSAEKYVTDGEPWQSSDSLELFMHDMFVKGHLTQADIGAEILILLGEL